MSELAVELKRLGHSVTVLTTTPHYNLDQTALLRQPMKRMWLGLLYYSEYDGIPVWHVKIADKGERIWARAFDYIRFHILSLAVSVWALGPQDIVIATSPPLTIGVMSSLLGFLWRAPSVYKVAEMYPDLAIRQGVVRNPILVKAMRQLERLVYSANTFIVPIAQQFLKIIRQRGVSDQKLRMIPDFVDTELYRPLQRTNPFAETHGLINSFVVLYGGNVGLVQDWNSVLFAAEALAHLPIQFAIVGNGSRHKWLGEEITSRGLKNVKLLGYQPKELMPEINASCDVGTIPMTKTGTLDGFPSKIYTIMACAKPVIASAEADSELAWIVRESGCGKVVPAEDPQAYTDAVLAAFRERESLPEKGGSGRRFVEARYSKEAIAREYDELIRQLTSR